MSGPSRSGCSTRCCDEDRCGEFTKGMGKRLAVRQNTTSCPTDQTGVWWEASQTAWGVKCTACVCVSIHEFRRSCCGVYICYHPRSDSGSVSPAIPSLVSYRVKGQLRLQAWWLMQKLQVDIRAKEVKNRLERMNVSAWVEACLDVRDGNVSSFTLLTFSCT